MTKIVQSDPVPEDDPLVLSIKEAVDAYKRQDTVAILHALTAALALAPARADLWQDLGAVYSRLEVWSACVTSLEIALALDPDRAGVRYVMALAMYYLGHREKAVALIEGRPP